MLHHVGAGVKARRKALGFSLRGLAKSLPIGYVMLCEFENGKKDTTVSVMLSICKELDMTLQELERLGKDVRGNKL